MGIYRHIRKIANYIERLKVQKYLEELVDNGLSLGKNTAILSPLFLDPSHCFLISIGDNCTICPNVRFIAHDASTKRFLGYTKIGRIQIKEDCFIGDSSIILPGVSIGPNSIVGAGSIVTRDVPPNIVACGNPAKPVASVDEYIEKITFLSANKRIFGKDYFIDKLDARKRQEIIRSIGDTIGFIV